MANTTINSVCPYCGVGCGIVMEVANNRVVKVSGNKQHPSNFGRLCTKGNTCAEPLSAPGRLTKAYVRTTRHSEANPVDIDSAIHTTAQRLRQIIDQHGSDAVALYVSGQMSLEAQYLANKLTKGFVGSKNIESNSRLCMASASSGYKLSLGADGPPGSYQDFDHADVFFIIGANMADCHPILYLRMMERVKAGAKLIVVDPRRTATADKASLFLQIKPGTDLALLNGLLHLIVANGHTTPDFIAEFTEGWEAMPEFLADYNPQHVAQITGLTESDLHQAAEWLGTAANWLSCWTMGLNQSSVGTWHTNAVCNLHLATGAICRPGSGPFSLTGQPNAMGGREMGYMGTGLPGQRSVLDADDRACIEQLWAITPGTIPVDAGNGTVGLFEDMQAGKIKACWIICTNPVATVPNRAKVIAALQTAELVICQDAFLDTETNRYADILLPAALWAEAEGVMVNSERNLSLMQKAVDAPGDALPDWQIIARVACAMGYTEAFSYDSAEAVFEELKQANNPNTGYDIRGASYDKLRTESMQWPCPPSTANNRNPIRYVADNESIQSSNKPRIAFPTDSGKAQFLPRPFLPAAEMPDADFPLILNTGRLQHQWHTMTKTRNCPTLNKLNPKPFVEINPEDAIALGITNNDEVTISSRRGSAILPAQLTERVRPGNCFAPFHWNDSFGDNLAINVVTSDAVDPISLQPAFKFCAVALKKVEAQQTNANNPASTNKASNLKPVDALAQLLCLEHIPDLVLDINEQLYMQGYVSGLRNNLVHNKGEVPILPDTSPFDPAKRFYLNGMLAGLFARTEFPADLLQALPTKNAAALSSTTPAITLLWASQTGNAENFAAQCTERLQAQGHSVRLASMAEINADELINMTQLLVIASTFGDGDAPDNGTDFWDDLQASAMPTLNSLQYAILAFGDSSYSEFCGFGKKLDARLDALGAQRLTDRVDCEPDYESPAANWLDRVIDKLGTSTKTQPHTIAIPPSNKSITANTEYNRKHPFPSRLLLNQRLNSSASAKEVRQFVFDTSGPGLNYQAGDALGVWPTNCPQLVAALLAELQLAPDTKITLKDKGELSLESALLQHLDITRITPDLLRFFHNKTGNPLLADLLDDARKKELNDWLWGRQIIDLLQNFPVKASAAEWLGVLKPLQPRLYSIASSPKQYPHEVHLTVSTVRFGGDDAPRGGACSTFLADRAEGVNIPIFIQKSAHFRLPNNPDTPIIMVGPGTGIAPFLAFLQERAATGASGRNWLFFGEQHAASDFYYQDELAIMQQQGILHRLDTAFSRDQANKVYVQHRMLEQGAELWRWLEEGAYFYVCGDATHMAKDVDAALNQIVQQHGKLSADAALVYVKQLAHNKRYLRDIY